MNSRGTAFLIILDGCDVDCQVSIIQSSEISIAERVSSTWWPPRQCLITRLVVNVKKRPRVDQNAMSKDNSTGENDSIGKPNRRNIIRMMGAGVVGIAGLGTASAEDVNSDEEIDLEALSGSRKEKAIAIAKGTHQYKQLYAKLQEEYDCHIDVSESEVLESTDQYGNPYQAVSFFPTPKRDSEEAPDNVDLVVTLKDDSLFDAGASVTDQRKDHIDIKLFTINNGQIEVESGSSEDVTVQVSRCGICRDVSTVLCNRGCSLGGATICAIAGFGTVGSIACAAVVSELCRRYGGNINRACRRFNICNRSGIC